jgi:hypothetical protein
LVTVSTFGPPEISSLFYKLSLKRDAPSLKNEDDIDDKISNSTKRLCVQHLAIAWK